MEPINVSTKAFTRELEWCARFIERKTTIPILNNILLRKSGELLYLTATDLEHGAQTSVPANGRDFELTVPVDRLLKYLKKVDPHDQALLLLPDVRYYPAKEGPHVEGCDGRGTEGCCEAPKASSVRLTIQHGDEDASVSIDGRSADSYPVLPVRPLQSIEIGGLETAIPRACIAIAHEESRFTLNGALLDIKDTTAQFISTDGHRLSVVDAKVFDCEWRLRNNAEPFRALIPKRALLELVRLGDSAFLCRDKDHVFFTVGERTIVTRILTGNFPDWERVMPNDLKYSVTVPNGAMRKVLDRVSVFADERSHAVELSVNGTLTLATHQHEHSASGQVPIMGPAFAYPYVSAFNAVYLTEFLKAADVSDFQFRFIKASKPAQCDVDGWRYVLMPMRGVADSDPVLEGEVEPAPAVIAYLAAQESAPAPVCAQCQQPMPGPTDTDLCSTCDKSWERAPAETAAEPAIEPEPVSAPELIAPAPELIRCVTCDQPLPTTAYEIRWDTKKPRKSCRNCRKQSKSVSATLQTAVAS